MRNTLPFMATAAALILLGPGQAGRAERPPGLSNPGFERGLEGWTKTGTAFDSQPTYLENVNGSRVNPITVGGDYWTDIAFPMGIRGDYWIGAHDNRPTERALRGQVQGDGPTGTLTSVAFRIPADTNFISFLIGGGDNLETLKIELLAAKESNYAPLARIASKTGLDSELLRRDWWSVAALDKTSAYVIRITDDATQGHINVDDFRFESSNPATAKRVDGLPALLRTAINGRTVWTDYDAKLWGAADLHTHPMSHLSMGGKLMHGAPDVGSLAPPGTIKQGTGCNQSEVRTTSAGQALPDCSATHGGWGVDNTCGDTIRAAAINIGYDTEFVHRIKFPHEGQCDPPMSMEAGLCYQTCAPGFHGFATLCVKSCPAPFRDDGLACGKPAAYGRGVGYPAGVDIYTKSSYGRGNGYSWDPFTSPSNGRERCLRDNPSGCDEGSPSIWYPKCRSGHTSIGLLCWENCRAGYNDDGLTCRRDGLAMAKESCERENVHGCEQSGLLMYPRCRAGFHAFGCCVCSPDCPAEMTDSGVSCTKGGTYDRGVGKPPLSNAHGDHQHAGWPAMQFWPHWSSKAHQQMYVDWIRRAHEGGLNVLVALAVNNELLGEVMNGSSPKDDKASADKQLDEIRSFIGRHTDFMWEVKSAAELRQAVKEGKLAVVVGIEVDNFGNFNVGNPALSADENAVKREIQRLWNDKGVRYIFPLHFADNVLGGVAVNGALFNLSNRFARTRPLPIGMPYPPGFLYRVESASDPLINYRLAFFGEDGEWAHGLTLFTAKSAIDALGATPFPPAFNVLECPIPLLACLTQFELLSSLLSPDSEWDQYQFVPGGQVNEKGLTAIGGVALKEMMRLGMIIDIDHMSDKAANRTLEIAREFSYPVNSGHTGFRHKPGQQNVNENMRTPAQLTRLGSLGGMMGVGWASGDASSYLENYRFGLEHGGTETCTLNRKLMQRTCAPATPPAFSLGSDINGFEEMPRARSGISRNVDLERMPKAGVPSNVEYCAAGDEAARARCRQDHPNWMRMYSFGTEADESPRTWNYNTEGVAHIGLYPDIYQDLKNLGMTASERGAFFGAVEAFARMWDKIEAQKSTVR